MIEFVENEISITRNALGDTWAKAVIKQANVLFNESPVQIAVKVAEKGVYSKEQQDRYKLFTSETGSGGALFKMMNGIFTGFIQSLYIVCLRLLIVMSWFVLLVPIMFAAVYDGYTQRVIKSYNFGSIRPATFSLMLWIVMPMLFAPLFYLSAPFNISPTIVPIWVCLALLPTSILIANSQPIFGQR
ncbi:DUF4400 domain-containing protein [Comamonas testosteroni]|uniref:DUF4400 domain-containing protein n=1 Tax=Comamonas testosteroni TaxID=285 RepID=UPI0005B3F993|nr:DUF4400 domain-containing protein [Comamonas testosteroni]